MHTIDLIFTKHEASGNCNSCELYKIIKSVKPEVIFEELSVSDFQSSYYEEMLRTLETDAIKLYMESHPVNHSTPKNICIIGKYFFIGSGHRESIPQKIRKYNDIQEPKLNWILHDLEAARKIT